MNRRRMLLQSLKLGAAVSLGHHVAREKTFALETGFLTELTGNPLRFPPVFANGGTMTLASSNAVVWPSTTTQVIAINGSYPCPTVRVQR